MVVYFKRKSCWCFPISLHSFSPLDASHLLWSFLRWVVTWGKCRLLQFDERWPNTKLGETFPLTGVLHRKNRKKKRRIGWNGGSNMDMAAEKQIGEQRQKGLLRLKFVPFQKNNKLLGLTGQINSKSSWRKLCDYWITGNSEFEQIL